MENIFKYYQFSAFFKDESDVFSGNQIAYTELNNTHYLIFEKKEDSYKSPKKISSNIQKVKKIFSIKNNWGCLVLTGTMSW